MNNQGEIIGEAKAECIGGERYLRHRSFFDSEGWKRLMQVPIVIAGVGGLGSHVLMSLIRLAPVTVELWDPGILDLPDLNRQILYGESDIGHQKVEAAVKRLSAINSDALLLPKPYALTGESFRIHSTYGDAAQIDSSGNSVAAVSNPLPPFVLFDCLDSFMARLELDTVRRRYQCPVFHGGVEGWFGQAGTFLPGGSGYAELLGPDCGKLPPAAKPILPQTVAAIAAFQVGEYVHWCRNPDKTPLSKALLIYDGLNVRTDLIELA